MKMKHTPGEWAISRDAVPPGHEQYTVYSEQDGQRVATAFRSEANASLIAAAPQLLEALKLLHDNLAEYQRINHLHGYDNQDMRMARAAIANATNQKGNEE